MGTIKLIHIITATLSISGFVLRGIWKLTDSPIGSRRGPQARDGLHAASPIGSRRGPQAEKEALLASLVRPAKRLSLNADSPLLKQRWVRIAPHINDTLLLALGLWLAFSIGQYPFVHDWLTAKILAVLAYIGFGMVALRFGRTRTTRIASFIAALATFAYIVGVALTRSATLSLLDT